MNTKPKVIFQRYPITVQCDKKLRRKFLLVDLGKEFKHILKEFVVNM